MTRKTLRLGLAMMLAMLMAACSEESKMEKLLGKLPAEADFVAVGDLKTVMESAGGSLEGSQITLPDVLTKSLPADFKEQLATVNAVLKDGGVDIEACAVALEYEKQDAEPIVVFALADEGKFTQTIEGKGIKKVSDEGGVVYYVSDTVACVAVSDGFAYMASASRMEQLRQTIAKAAEKSFAQTPLAEYILGGNAGGMSAKIPEEGLRELEKAGINNPMLLSLYKGYFCFKGDLEGDKLTASFKMFNEDFTPKTAEMLKELTTFDAPISSEALEFFPANETLVCAYSLKGFNWDKYFEIMGASLQPDQRMQLALAKGYLEKIDGTFAFGVGVMNGMESFRVMNQGEAAALTQLSFTLVAETKDGSAQSMLNDIKTLLATMGVSGEETEKGIKLSLMPLLPSDIFIETHDDFLVLANHAISSDNSNATAAAIKGDWIGAGGIVATADDKLMKDLGIANNVSLTATGDKNMEGKISLEIAGGEGKGVIEKLLLLAEKLK